MGSPTLQSKAFTPTHVRNNPKIYTGHSVCGGKYKFKSYPSQDAGYLKGYLLIRYLWMQGTGSIHYMRVVNTDATSYQSKSPEKCLEAAEKVKKNKYLDACLKQRRQFIPFVVPMDGLLRVKAEAKLKCIYSCLTTKWK